MTRSARSLVLAAIAPIFCQSGSYVSPNDRDPGIVPPMLRLFSFVLLLHLYIGLRLLPDMPFGTLGVAALGGWLIVSTSLTPLGLLARRIKRQPLSHRLAWAGLLAIGSLSSLLVLTLIRDVVLLVGHAVSGWL